MNWLRNIFFGRTFGVKRNPSWVSIRNEFIKVYSVCAVCDGKRRLEVHHITPIHKDKEKELDWSNLITLCRPHHFWFGHLGSWFSHNPSILFDAKIWNEKIKNR